MHKEVPGENNEKKEVDKTSLSYKAGEFVGAAVIFCIGVLIIAGTAKLITLMF